MKDVLDFGCRAFGGLGPRGREYANAADDVDTIGDSALDSMPAPRVQSRNFAVGNEILADGEAVTAN